MTEREDLGNTELVEVVQLTRFRAFRTVPIDPKTDEPIDEVWVALILDFEENGGEETQVTFAVDCEMATTIAESIMVTVNATKAPE